MSCHTPLPGYDADIILLTTPSLMTDYFLFQTVDLHTGFRFFFYFLQPLFWDWYSELSTRRWPTYAFWRQHWRRHCRRFIVFTPLSSSLIIEMFLPSLQRIYRQATALEFSCRHWETIFHARQPSLSFSFFSFIFALYLLSFHTPRIFSDDAHVIIIAAIVSECHFTIIIAFC